MLYMIKRNDIMKITLIEFNTDSIDELPDGIIDKNDNLLDLMDSYLEERTYKDDNIDLIILKTVYNVTEFMDISDGSKCYYAFVKDIVLNGIHIVYSIKEKMYVQ